MKHVTKSSRTLRLLLIMFSVILVMVSFNIQSLPSPALSPLTPQSPSHISGNNSHLELAATEKLSPQRGFCDRPNALFDRSGKPCGDLVKISQRQNMFVSTVEGARFVTCVPPKNGNSYHKGVIFRLLGDPKYYDFRTVHFKEEVLENMRVENFTSDEIASFFTDPAWPKYAVVRNPLLRTLSGYINSVEHNLHSIGTTRSREESFQLWVRASFVSTYKPRITGGHRNQHVRSQFRFCGFNYDDMYKRWTIFKFEEPKGYVDYIYNTIPHVHLDDGWGDNMNNSFREFVLGPRSRTHDTSGKFASFIGSLELFDQLADALREETEFFGYKKAVADLRIDVENKLGDLR